MTQFSRFKADAFLRVLISQVLKVHSLSGTVVVLNLNVLLNAKDKPNSLNCWRSCRLTKFSQVAIGFKSREFQTIINLDDKRLGKMIIVQSTRLIFRLNTAQGLFVMSHSVFCFCFERAIAKNKEAKRH